jgi:prepilin-type processing-associated H-X9-DG protein
MKSRIGLRPRISQNATGAADRAAFTRVELLVVIASVILLTALLLPALANGSMQEQAIKCMNNQSQLAKAWTMYAGDNKGSCANNFGISQVALAVAQGHYDTWCLDVIDWTTSAQNTNTALLQKGQLGAYLGGSVAAFKCPADNYLSSLQFKAGFPARLRSCSMNSFLGHFSEGNDTTYHGANPFNPSWPQYLTIVGISQPSQIFVFLDEHPDSINDGYFQDGTQTLPTDAAPTWEGSDTPASYHNGAGSFAFGDGHAEIHKWRNPKTVTPVNPVVSDDPTPPGPGGLHGSFVDRAWLCAHSCILP